jgi:hypothetical protein
MTEAVLVRVTTEIEVAGGRAVALWIVATADRSEAKRIVRERVSDESVVEVSDAPVSPETTGRLRLAPGQAWQL